MSTDLPEIVTRFVGDARPLLTATAEARAAIKAYAEDAKRYSTEQTATVKRAQQSQADDIKRYQAEQAATLKRYQAEQKAALATADSEKAAELARFREEQKAATARYNAEQLAATRRFTAEQNALIRARLAEQRLMQAKAAEESGASRAFTKVVGGSPIGSAVGGEAFMGMGAGGMAVGAAAVGIGALATGMAAVGYESLKAAGNFEQATTRLVTSAGEDRKNIDMVRKGLLDMSAQVGYSAQDLASGMYMVESAGFHGADALKVERAAAEGAKAENADLATVSNAVTTALLDYGKGADGAADMTSKLVAATSVGKTTFENLTGALHSVLPAAGQLHVPLQDILGSLAAMTVHGMSAEQAAQNLNDVLRHMERPTATQAHELALLHMNTAEFADDLKSKGLAGTLQLVSDKMKNFMPPGSDKVILDVTNAVKGLDPAVQALASHVFDGSMSLKDYHKAARDLDPIQAKQALQFETLIGGTHRLGDAQMTGAQVMQTYGQFWQNLTGDATGMNVAMMLTGQNEPIVTNAIKTIGGATADASGHVKGWSDIQQTLNQQLSQMKAGAEALGIKLGEKLMPTVKEILKDLADFGGKVKNTFDRPDVKSAVDNLDKAFGKMSKDSLKELKKDLDDLAGFIDKNHTTISRFINFIANDVMPVLGFFIKMGIRQMVIDIELVITTIKMWQDTFDFLRHFIVGWIKVVAGMWLDFVDGLLLGADKAFGWVPGLGPKLDKAVKDFQRFKDGVNAQLDALDGKSVNVYVHAHLTGTNLIQTGDTYTATGGAGVKFKAEGGPIEAYRPYVIGEHGPELVVPNYSGHVFTASQTRQILGGSPNTFSLPRTSSGGGSGGGGGQAIVIHNVIELDGRKVYEGIVPHAQRHKGRNPTTALV